MAAFFNKSIDFHGNTVFDAISASNEQLSFMRAGNGWKDIWQTNKNVILVNIQIFARINITPLFFVFFLSLCHRSWMKNGPTTSACFNELDQTGNKFCTTVW